MQPTTIFLTIVLLATLFLFTRCASLTGFQTGRTVGEGNGEVLGSINVSQTPEFDTNQDDTTDVRRYYFPNVEVSARYGVIEKLDIGMRINSNLNFAMDARYQFIGDQESPVAVAAGLGFGTFGLFFGLWNVQVPLYLSFHPSDALDIYITPRYIAQFSTATGLGNLSYYGGNAGILFGRRIKVGLDVGYYNIGTTGVREVLPITTFGAGVKFPF